MLPAPGRYILKPILDGLEPEPLGRGHGQHIAAPMRFVW
jgi:hypothetical protein